MANPKVMSGNLRLTLDDGTIFHATSCTLSLTREFKERATKDTDGTQRGKGIKSWTASADSLATYGEESGTNDFFALFDMYDDDTDEPIEIEFVPDEDDITYKLEGEGFIESLEMNAENDEDATASISIVGNNKLKKVELD